MVLPAAGSQLHSHLPLNFLDSGSNAMQPALQRRDQGSREVDSDESIAEFLVS